MVREARHGGPRYSQNSACPLRVWQEQQVLACWEPGRLVRPERLAPERQELVWEPALAPPEPLLSALGQQVLARLALLVQWQRVLQALWC